jgi:hypothetical protein
MAVHNFRKLQVGAFDNLHGFGRTAMDKFSAKLDTVVREDSAADAIASFKYDNFEVSLA